MSREEERAVVSLAGEVEELQGRIISLERLVGIQTPLETSLSPTIPNPLCNFIDTQTFRIRRCIESLAGIHRVIEDAKTHLGIPKGDERAGVPSIN